VCGCGVVGLPPCDDVLFCCLLECMRMRCGGGALPLLGRRWCTALPLGRRVYTVVMVVVGEVSAATDPSPPLSGFKGDTPLASTVVVVVVVVEAEDGTAEEDEEEAEEGTASGGTEAEVDGSTALRGDGG
jgi:hypothetical protein